MTPRTRRACPVLLGHSLYRASNSLTVIAEIKSDRKRCVKFKLLAYLIHADMLINPEEKYWFQISYNLE